MAVQPGSTAPAQPQVHSILAADVGSVHTRLVLIDQVAGQYRLVGSVQTLTTTAPPLNDVMIGLLRALDQIGAQTGRVLESRGVLVLPERGDGSGVDQFVATASGGSPMRTVLVGLMPDVSLASGKQALGSIYAQLVEILALGDQRSQEQQVNGILNSRPDLVFIVGGTDGGAQAAVLALVDTVRLAVSLLPIDRRPVVVYAGNEALRLEVQALLGDQIEQIHMTGNVRPSLGEERLGEAQLELAVAYGAYRSRSAGGFSELRALSPLGVLPTATSYSTVMRYLGESTGSGNTLCVDIGSSTVTVCAAIKNEATISIRPDLGLGQSAATGVTNLDPKAVQRWLSWDATDSDVINYAWNKSLQPGTIPQTNEELELEHALARELMRVAIHDARASWKGYERGELLPPLRTVIGSGAVLAQGVEPGIAAMLLLDALQPVGVTRLELDSYGLIPALGGIAYLQPLAVVQVLESGGLLSLGTAICPEGKIPSGEALRLTIEYADGRAISRVVNGASFLTFDVPPGQKAKVTVRLLGRLTLNGRRGTVTLTVNGGAVGVIVDTRGRPFTLSGDPVRRRAALSRWQSAARTADPGESIRSGRASRRQGPVYQAKTDGK